MNSTIRHFSKATLHFILPFIVVLLASTIVFGQSDTSFPITITFTTHGSNLKNLPYDFSGIINFGFSADANGCYVSFVSNDGTTSICITSIFSAFPGINTNEPRGSSPTRMVGTGTVVIPVEGIVRQGIVYIDVKGTWKWDPSKTTLIFNGKIGGAGQDFVLTGNFKSTFVYTND